MTSVTVRMYDMGFGDCFLVSVPTHAGIKKILIDCGSMKKHKKSAAEISDQVIADVRDAHGNPHIDVVIATHRHGDHVSGFSRPAWDAVRVDEVWMPWTEHPTDPQAIKIRQRQSSLAAHLKAALQGVAGMNDYLEMAANALTNEAAMDRLHRGFSGNPRRLFLPGDDAPNDEVATHVLPGVTAYVLGPSRDPEIIRDMDPPSGESYLQLLESGKPGRRVAPTPFAKKWRDPDPQQLSERERSIIESIGSDLEQSVAVQLEKAVNGTSLMLVLRVGDKHFLFPGDAQWGTWNAALTSPRWKPILQQTLFYKVGHHGSHNATPIDFVEDPDGIYLDSAMVPVTPRGSWDIPRKPLLDALRQNSEYGIVRGDEMNVSQWFKRNGDWWVEAEIPI